MAAVLKTALAAICAFTLLATAFLTASLLILRPPRANYQQWAFVATVIVAQGVLTFSALFASKHPRHFGDRGLRYVALAAGLAMAWIGASWVYNTMSGAHFEGYALVLGCAMVLQGALTLAVFARQRSPAND